MAVPKPLPLACSLASDIAASHHTTLRQLSRQAPDLTEDDVHEALHRLDPLWDELFPAEQTRIVRALVERVGKSGPAGADIRLRTADFASLVRDLTGNQPEALRAAA